MQPHFLSDDISEIPRTPEEIAIERKKQQAHQALIDFIKLKNAAKKQPDKIDHEIYSARCMKTVAKMQAVLEGEEEAINLKNQINAKFASYKQELAAYVVKKLNKDTLIHAKYVNQVLPDDAHVERSKIMEKIIINLDNEPEDGYTKIFARKHLNFARAVANYKLVDVTEKKFNLVNNIDGTVAKPPRLTQRLKTLYDDIPKIEKDLKQVGDEAVDRQTSGFIGFFRKIWNQIKWKFRETAGKNTKQFAKTAVDCRNKFFTVKRKLEPNYVKDREENKRLIKTIPSIRMY